MVLDREMRELECKEYDGSVKISEVNWIKDEDPWIRRVCMPHINTQRGGMTQVSMVVINV